MMEILVEYRRIQHLYDSESSPPQTRTVMINHCIVRESASHREEEKLLQDHPLRIQLERV